QQQPSVDNLQSISVEEAVQRAKADYPSVRSARLTIESREALKKTAWDLGTTRIFTGKEEVGNGALGIQTVIGLEQAGIDPFSIAPKLDLRDEKTDLARSALGLTLLEVERAVRKDWSDVYITKRRYRLYRELDSLFTEFARAVRLRYEQ